MDVGGQFSHERRVDRDGALAFSCFGLCDQVAFVVAAEGLADRELTAPEVYVGWGEREKLADTHSCPVQKLECEGNLLAVNSGDKAPVFLESPEVDPVGAGGAYASRKCGGIVRESPKAAAPIKNRHKACVDPPDVHGGQPGGNDPVLPFPDGERSDGKNIFACEEGKDVVADHALVADVG